MVTVVNVTIDLSVTMVTLVTKVSIAPQLCYYLYQGYQTTHSRIIFLVFSTWTNFNKDFSIDYIIQNGKNPRAKQYRGINFVWQYLIFVGLQYGTCFMLPFSCLEFSRIFLIFGKFVDLCYSLH